MYKIYDVSNARRIGAGGFGKVYLIREKNSKKKHAAKYQKLTTYKLKEIVRTYKIIIEINQCDDELRFLTTLGERRSQVPERII